MLARYWGIYVMVLEHLSELALIECQGQYAIVEWADLEVIG